MDFPKYIEFIDGAVVLFSPELIHRNIAFKASRQVSSAGFAQFKVGESLALKTWGESVSLNVRSQPVALTAQTTWFGGRRNSLTRQFVMSTDQALARELGTKGKALVLIATRNSVGVWTCLPTESLDEASDYARFNNTLSFGDKLTSVRLLAETTT